MAIREAFAHHRRVLFVMATGAGKTACASYIAKGVQQKKKRVLILAHRRELLDQISRSLTAWGVRHGVIDAQRIGIPRTDVVVGSVFTVARRLRHMPPYDLIIQDEAHHCSGDNTFSKVLAHFPNAHQLGITATAARASGEPLGATFDHLVLGPQTAELIALGALCPFDVYAPSAPDLSGLHRRGGDWVQSELDDRMNTPTVTGSALQHYTKLAPGKLAVAFCVSLKHAAAVAAEFNAAGIPAAQVDGKMDSYTRARNLRAFASGEVRVLTSVSLITEGWDCPQAEVGIMLRPTESMPLYLQMAGRLLRTHPNKQRAIILDASSLTNRHGFLDEQREWSLAGENTAPKGDAVARVATCEKCYACYPSGTKLCPRCGNIPSPKYREVKHVDGELVQIGSADVYNTTESTDELSRQFFILKSVAKNRGYTDPESWAFRIVSAKLADRLAKERGLPAGTVNGLTAQETVELRERTIERERVMKAMSLEDAPVNAGGG